MGDAILPRHKDESNPRVRTLKIVNFKVQKGNNFR